MTSVYWSQPTAVDDNKRVMLLHATHLPGESFPVGVSSVEYIFADDSYNMAVCQFSVIVNEGAYLFCFVLVLFYQHRLYLRQSIVF